MLGNGERMLERPRGGIRRMRSKGAAGCRADEEHYEGIRGVITGQHYGEDEGRLSGYGVASTLRLKTRHSMSTK